MNKHRKWCFVCIHFETCVKKDKKGELILPEVCPIGNFDEFDNENKKTKYTKKQIQTAMKKSYEHNQFNSIMFWSFLKDV